MLGLLWLVSSAVGSGGNAHKKSNWQRRHLKAPQQLLLFFFKITGGAHFLKLHLWFSQGRKKPILGGSGRQLGLGVGDFCTGRIQQVIK